MSEKEIDQRIRFRIRKEKNSNQTIREIYIIGQDKK